MKYFNPLPKSQKNKNIPNDFPKRDLIPLRIERTNTENITVIWMTSMYLLTYRRNNCNRLNVLLFLLLTTSTFHLIYVVDKMSGFTSAQ